MSTIFEVTVDSTDFALGRALSVDPDVVITLEEVIPTGSRAMPYFWATGERLEAFETAVEDDPTVDAVRRHLKVQNSVLYYAEWDERVDDFLSAIAREEGTVLSGVGAEGTWEFTLQFPDRDHLSRFRERCREHEVSLDVRRIYSVDDPAAAEFDLTDKQRTTLVTAYEEGYFEVPRAVTQQELADELGIRSSAVSETLRRAIGELVAETLVEDPVGPGER